ncbi:DUF6064 family protein [Fulvimarina sp. 2208YS6-2-32]|uniref:DUF6064 family protein n=1 Tax=Fulvimarina uroteuthidis TaxID=3098149 RepID=A0ABU5I4Z9_9HYPH|nr:DUF6064 family protein [Fulvimarina sp. 2208YS6-2-32]MDY8109236.1 DUF6064 family protein [Fulvimarina sp. 2208YS6-2-32]
METFATYQLQDFLLFSERVYRRLFEAQNAAWWPLPPVLAGLGLAFLLLIALRRGGASRRIAGASLLAVALVWGFVAVDFLLGRYAPISPIALAGAYAFMAEAVLLAIVAALGLRARATLVSGLRLTLGIFLAGLGILIYPAIGFVRNGGAVSAEWFGMAPDPTAIATLGFLVIAVRGRWALAGLSIVPCLWLCLSALTLRVFGDPAEWVLFAAVGLALVALVLPARRQAGAE